MCSDPETHWRLDRAARDDMTAPCTALLLIKWRCVRFRAQVSAFTLSRIGTPMELEATEVHQLPDATGPGFPTAIKLSPKLRRTIADRVPDCRVHCGASGDQL